MSAKSPNENSPNEKSKSRKPGTRASSSDRSGRSVSAAAERLKETDPQSFSSKFKNRDYGAIVRDVWDTIDLWRATRDWKRMLWFLPSFLLLTGFLGVVYWGKSKTKDQLLRQYLKLADAESPAVNPGEELNATAELTEDQQAEKAKASEYSELLYRRILQLDSGNEDARYYVASRLAAGSNPTQGRAMMQELAPLDPSRRGHEPAHAWMAVDLFKRRMRNEPIDLDVIGHHLKMASGWEKVTPSLLLLYSRYLEDKEKNYPEAISVLQKAAIREPKLQLALAELCVRGKNMTMAKGVAEELIKKLSENLGKKEETEDDRIGIAQAKLILTDIDGAIDVLQTGLVADPSRARVRRALSDILRMKYRATVKQTENGVEADLQLLNKALMVDPSNPKIGEEIAQLVTADAKYIQNDEILDKLRTQLADGSATAVVHLLLANAYQVRGQTKKAMSHWELCLAQNPNQVLALNNLSVAIVQADPKQVTRSLEMIERALKIAGPDPELLDSYGTILLVANRTNDAIAAMEKAISVDPERISTREKLASAYENVELPDLAEKQRTRIVEIKKELEQRAIIAAEQARIRKEREAIEEAARIEAEAKAAEEARLAEEARRAEEVKALEEAEGNAETKDGDSAKPEGDGGSSTL